MPTQKSSTVSATEAKSLFADLADLPALVLAVSGGPDSTALMVLVARWREALRVKPKLVAVTVDHGLRAESKREAANVARLARKLKIAHRTLRWTGAKPATGLPQAARQARYRLLSDAARKVGAAHILTAHTLDDQAETVLIRMTRGSGITGLGAMRRCTPLARLLSSPSPLEGEGWAGGYAASSSNKKLPPSRRASHIDLPRKGRGKEENASRAADQIFLLRPFLDIPKARLIATLRAAKIAFADDSSNRDPRFTRARLRGLMPELAREGLDARRLSLLALRLRRANAAIEAAVDRAVAELAADAGGPGPIVLDASGYSRLPDEIALRLIGRAVTEVGSEGPVELAKLEALKVALDAAQKAGPKTGKMRFRRSLAGAIVTLGLSQIAVERAPPRRSKALTTRRRGKAKSTKAR